MNSRNAKGSPDGNHGNSTSQGSKKEGNGKLRNSNSSENLTSGKSPIDDNKKKLKFNLIRFQKADAISTPGFTITEKYNFELEDEDTTQEVIDDYIELHSICEDSEKKMRQSKLYQVDNFVDYIDITINIEDKTSYESFKQLSSIPPYWPKRLYDEHSEFMTKEESRKFARKQIYFENKIKEMITIEMKEHRIAQQQKLRNAAKQKNRNPEDDFPKVNWFIQNVSTDDEEFLTDGEDFSLGASFVFTK